MKKNNINNLIIISIVSIVVLIGIIFAVICFATDTFKSNKTLFYKYASQIDLKEMIDLDEYNKYMKRLETEGHANEGEFSIDIASGEDKVNESITWTGYTDTLNKKSNYDLSIKKDKVEMLGLNYLNDGGIYGILFKDIVNQYIAVENNNLKDFATKFGVNEESIPNKIERTKAEDYLNYDELNPIINKYYKTAIEQIPENNYSKVKKQNITVGDTTIKADGYQVQIHTEDMKNIVKKILNDAKNDEDLFEQINKFDNALSFEKYQEDIQELINNFDDIEEDKNSEDSNEKNEQYFTITVYKKDKKTVKISFELDGDGISDEDKMEVSIEKTTKGLVFKFEYNSVQQNISNLLTISKEQDGIITIENKNSKKNLLGSDEENSIKITITRNGDLNSSNVEFVVDTSILLKTNEQSQAINIKLENTTDFSKAPENAEFTNENHLVINTLSPEQLNNLFTNLGKLVSEKLKDEEIFPMVFNMFSIANSTQMSTNDSLESLKEQEITMFNQSFELYGGSISGASVKDLIMKIETNNSDEANHNIEYDTSVLIDNSKLYNITFEKDDEGYISKVNIEDV